MYTIFLIFMNIYSDILFTQINQIVVRYNMSIIPITNTYTLEWSMEGRASSQLQHEQNIKNIIYLENMYYKL